MNEIIIKTFSFSGDDKLPKYGTENSAGADFYCLFCEYIGKDRDSSVTSFKYTMEPGSTVRVHTGVYMSIPDGYYMQLNPRSGLACKHGVTLANSPGIIDSDYRGEIIVVLRNEGYLPVTINSGDRIAQGIFIGYSRAKFDKVDNLNQLGYTDRGAGGFGSTGKN